MPFAPWRTPPAGQIASCMSRMFDMRMHSMEGLAVSEHCITSDLHPVAPAVWYTMAQSVLHQTVLYDLPRTVADALQSSDQQCTGHQQPTCT